MISAAVGRGGETMISAQTVEAFWNAVEAREAALGRAQLLARPRPDVPVPLRALGEVDARPSPATRTPACPTRCRRRASTSSPPTWARYLGEFADAGLVNIAGGCCGNTPEHIAAIAKALDGTSRRAIAARPRVGRAPRRRGAPRRRRPLRLSGSQPFTQQPGVYIMIGERTNVAGSPKFAKLDQGGQVRRGGQRRAPAGRERRQRHRHLHGRRDDRRRRGDDALPLAPRRASPRSPRCRSWSTPRSGRSSRRASSACRARAS